jgi:hypothetical protein
LPSGEEQVNAEQWMSTILSKAVIQKALYLPKVETFWPIWAVVMRPSFPQIFLAPFCRAISLLSKVLIFSASSGAMEGTPLSGILYASSSTMVRYTLAASCELDSSTRGSSTELSHSATEKNPFSARCRIWTTS